MNKLTIVLTVIGLSGGALSAGLFLGGELSQKQRNPGLYDSQGSYRAASISIEDLDGSPGTSSADWATAYEVLGRKYDVHTSDPTRLPINDLQKIVDHYSTKTE